MTADALLYGNALRGTSNRYSAMAVNRAQVRNLLMPGIYQRGGDRGVPFTEEEIEAVVAAYIAQPQSRNAIDGAVRKMDELVALPLALRKQQAALAPLRSISPAYKQSKIPVHFRNQEIDHEPRKSTQKAARRTPQSPSASWHGGAQAGVGYGGSGGSAGLLAGSSVGSWVSAAGYTTPLIPGQVYYPYPPGSWVVVGSNIALPKAPEPEPPLPVEINAGELVAWRCWRIVGGGKLISMTQSTVWEEGVAQEADVEGGLGIHAWKTEAQARDYAKTYYTEPVAVGTVELWGHVIEHDEGYRAQYGQIKEVVERMVAYPQPRHRAAYGTLTFTPDNDKPRDPPSPLAWGFGAGGGLIISGAGLASSHPGLGPLMVAIGCGVIAASIVIHAAFRP